MRPSNQRSYHQTRDHTIKSGVNGWNSGQYWTSRVLPVPSCKAGHHFRGSRQSGNDFQLSFTSINQMVVQKGGSLICAIVTIALLSYSDSAYLQSMSDSQRSTTTSLAIVVYMLLTLVSAMLLFGVLKSKPTYILPFFGIQFIDFLFTLPQFLTSLYSQPNPHQLHNWSDRRSTFLDMRHIWPNASPNNVYTSSLLFTTLIVLFKSYFLCVVWKCYRYLRMKELVLPLHLPHFSHNITNDVSIDSIN